LAKREEVIGDLWNVTSVVWRLQSRRTQGINTVKYADYLVLLAKEELVLQDMIDKLTEIGRCCEMEMNVEKNKIIMRISRQPFPVKLMIEKKNWRMCGIFKYLGSMLTNDGRHTCAIKYRIAVAKAAFNKKRALFMSRLDLELRKKVLKCYIWSIAL
jgi:hypothetical protein